jgi:hypothetical protein
MGSGNWGTAFGVILADAGCDVSMWARRPEVADAINAGRNDAYLPELDLPPSVRATTDADEALDGADIVVLAVPSQTLRANLSQWSAAIPAGAPVVSLMKGVELGTTMRMSEVIAEAASATKTVARFSRVQVEAGGLKTVKLKVSAAFVRDAQKRGIRRIRATLTINTVLGSGEKLTTAQRITIVIPKAAKPVKAKQRVQPKFTG